MINVKLLKSRVSDVSSYFDGLDVLFLMLVCKLLKEEHVNKQQFENTFRQLFLKKLYLNKHAFNTLRKTLKFAHVALFFHLEFKNK